MKALPTAWGPLQLKRVSHKVSYTIQIHKSSNNSAPRNRRQTQAAPDTPRHQGSTSHLPLSATPAHSPATVPGKLGFWTVTFPQPVPRPRLLSCFLSALTLPQFPAFMEPEKTKLGPRTLGRSAASVAPCSPAPGSQGCFLQPCPAVAGIEPGPPAGQGGCAALVSWQGTEQPPRAARQFWSQLLH